MLFNKINGLVQTLRVAHPQSAHGYFKQTLRENLPALPTEYEEALTTAALHYILHIPETVDQLAGAYYQDQSTSLAQRCCIVCSLAYLVQPKDLLPDYLKGGYGFLDDTIILRYTLVHNLKRMPTGIVNIGEEKIILSFLTACLPHPIQTSLVPLLWGIIQRMQMLDTGDALFLQSFHDQCVADPIGFLFTQLPWEPASPSDLVMPPESVVAAARQMTCRATGDAVQFDFANLGSLSVSGDQIRVMPLTTPQTPRSPAAQ